ncbi:MAG: poly(3-hydroxybutyrate) depolymerase [Hyphomicrobiaceae bacterium]
MRTIFLLALLACLLPTRVEARQSAIALPRLGVAIQESTVSGISSGAYMAGQVQMAHGDIIKGAAIIAGGPYGCAESAFAPFLFGPAAVAMNANKAINGCMLGLMAGAGVPDPSGLARRTAGRAARGEIAPLDALRKHRVYLFTGTNDTFVAPSIVRSAYAFYRAIGVPNDAIRLVDTLPAGHGFVTETEGAACEVSRSPFVIDCDFDLAGDILATLHGPLIPPGPPDLGFFVTFDQRPFQVEGAATGLADEGVIYVPDACRNARSCRVHIAFHGCAQNRDMVGDVFIGRTGFARWAATNRIAVLFPQTRASSLNPQGCWDWWGFTGRQFLTRSAPQIRAVRAMLDELAK